MRLAECAPRRLILITCRPVSVRGPARMEAICLPLGASNGAPRVYTPLAGQPRNRSSGVVGNGVTDDESTTRSTGTH